MTTGARRYSITAREDNSDRKCEVCQVDTNPPYHCVRINREDFCWHSLGDAATQVVQKLSKKD
jgi:hypothetical protein